MNIQSTRNNPQIQVARAASAAPAAQSAEAPKPSHVDVASIGATKGADLANGLLGAYSMGTGLALTGAVAGTAISLGGDIISAVKGAISGDSGVTISSILKAGLSAGMWGAGGAILGGAVGATSGFYLGRGVGRFAGNIAGNATRKLNGNENLGRALGTVGSGLALAAFAGNGTNALVVGGAATLGAVVHWANN